MTAHSHYAAAGTFMHVRFLEKRGAKESGQGGRQWLAGSTHVTDVLFSLVAASF